ncbi:carbohydrate kinase family protein [Paracoccus pacificus]|uniref:Carbohydrate kinase n=1 Tax=Paracoccus pacificus TaxID=1463598 RepID=A0ABW4R9K9_9RHOB
MILCTGEALIDMVPLLPEKGAAATDQPPRFAALTGGAVFNTAVALGRLGTPTGYLWPLSRDVFGERLSRPLAEAGVDLSLCPRSDRPTTLAFVTLYGGEARYDFYDEGSAGRMFSAADLPRLPPEVTAIFCGGISLVPDPCGATVEALVAAESGRLPVMIDPNVRAFFVRDSDAYRARLMRFLRMADLVKLSGDDIEWLFPGKSGAEAAAEVLGLGARVVFLTSGGAGARAIWGGGDILVKAPSVTVADTIGAGDTFNAGVLAALHRDGFLTKAGIAGIGADGLRAALDLGTRAAAVTVSRSGANPPWAQEI